MSIIERFLDTDFTLLTTSSILATLDPPSMSNAVSLSFDNNFVGVRLSGFNIGSGTVTLQGSTSESITFPANGELISNNTFTSLSNIGTSGLTGESLVGKVEVFLSTSAGAPIEYRTTVGSYKGRISNRRRDFRNIAQGFEVETKPILFAIYPGPPAKVRDYVQAVGRTFSVESITYPADLIGTVDHQEMELREVIGE